MNIYVGNLSYEANEDDLRHVFKSFGDVVSVNIIKDRYTNASKGFGFVEMPAESEAQSAIDGLNGKDLKGKTLTVNEARSRVEYRGGRGNKGSGHIGGRRF